MHNPYPMRTGTIRVGHKVHKCGQCKTIQSIENLKCEKCGQSNWGAEFPQALNYFTFGNIDERLKGKITELYGPKPTRLDCTFLLHPRECLTIGLECYQGRNLFCRNHWAWDARTFLWSDSGHATRRSRETLGESEIKCDPMTCPYRIGSDTIKSACRERIIMELYLYKLPDLNLFRFVSGGIRTLQSIITKVQAFMGLTGGQWPGLLRLELKVRLTEGYQPADESNTFKKTTFPEVYLEIPESIPKLTAGNAFITLPASAKHIAIPDHAEGTYDELVDGNNEKPEAEPIDISNLDNHTEPIPPQGEPTICPETERRIRELAKAYGQNEYGMKKILGKGLKTFGGKSLKTLPESTALKILAWLNELILQDATTGAGMETDDTSDLEAEK